MIPLRRYTPQVNIGTIAQLRTVRFWLRSLPLYIGIGRCPNLTEHLLSRNCDNHVDSNATFDQEYAQVM